MKRLCPPATYTAALALLLATTAIAVTAQDANTAAANQITGMIVPDRIYDRQPFSFTASQASAGEVISIQTVEGVVVQRASADKYGRVFLAVGLPAAAYLVSRGGGQQPHSLGQIQVAHI